MYNLLLSELLQYIGNMFQKSLNVYDTWFGFYGNFKKGTLHVHMNNPGVNGLNSNRRATRRNFFVPSRKTEGVSIESLSSDDEAVVEQSLMQLDPLSSIYREHVPKKFECI